MTDKGLMARCREFLNAQKLQNKLTSDGQSIMIRVRDKVIELTPSAPDGFPKLGISIVLGFQNTNDMGVIWNNALTKYNLQEDFDAWFGACLNLTMLPGQTEFKKRCVLWWKFEDDTELTTLFADPQNFMDLCQKLIDFSALLVGTEGKVP